MSIKIFLIIIILSVISCGNNVLVYGLYQEPQDIVFYKNNTVLEKTISNMIFDRLLNINPQTQELEPSLARTWKQLDAFNWEIKLRDDVKFHNGNHFNAEDVKFSFEKVAFKKLDMANHYRIDIIDDYTIKLFTGSRKSILELYNLTKDAFSIIDKETVESIDEGINFEKPIYIGTGPFMFSRWVDNEYIYLKANKNYFEGQPKLDGIKYVILTQAQDRWTQLLEGTVDVSSNLLNFYKQELSTDFHIKDIDTGGYLYGAFNFKNKYLANKDVRQALIYATNRKEMINDQSTLSGAGEIATIPLTPNSFAFEKDWQALEYNITKANEILDKAGYKKDQYGIRFTLTITSIVGDAFLNILIENYKKIGVNVNPIYQSINAVSEKSFHKDDYDILLLAVVSSVSRSADLLYDTLSEEHFYSYTEYFNANIDDLLKMSFKENKLDKKKALYSQVIKIAMDNYFHIPISYYKKRIYIRKNIINFQRLHIGFYKPYLIEKI